MDQRFWPLFFNPQPVHVKDIIDRLGDTLDLRCEGEGVTRVLVADVTRLVDYQLLNGTTRLIARVAAAGLLQPGERAVDIGVFNL